MSLLRRAIDETRQVVTDPLFGRTFLFLSAMVVLVLTGLILAGCTTIEYRETPLADRIPQSLLTTTSRPARRPLPMQSDVGKLLVETDAWGGACQLKLGAINELVAADAVAAIARETQQ